jgi:hypothetical protein
MEDCLRSMMPRSDASLLNGTTGEGVQVNGHAHRGRHPRRVLLASAIAESSVTVPGVTCVIDMCRSLEVRWHNDSKSYTPKTVWSSRSICGQRRGRTGRTCAGRVFRLLPRQFYHRELDEWDVPQLTISSCHNEVLALTTAKTKSINARALLLHSAGRDGGSCCLDPLEAGVVEDAVEHLKELGACDEEESEQKSNFLSSSRRKTSNNNLPPPLVPTTYGLLLAALPLAVRDSSVVLAGAQVGLLYEAMALRAICNHKPNPIVHYFGERERNNYTLLSYYPDYDDSDPISAHLANLAAYMYWDAEWNSMRAVQAKASFVEKCQREHLLQQQLQDASHVASWNVWKWTEQLEEEHILWCREHEINPTAVRSISEVLENTIHVFYKAQFEPEWLNCNNPTPIWKLRSDWRGHASYGDRGMFQRVYSRPELVCDALGALCNNKTSVATTIAHKLLGVPMAPFSRLRRPQPANQQSWHVSTIWRDIVDLETSVEVPIHQMPGDLPADFFIKGHASRAAPAFIRMTLQMPNKKKNEQPSEQPGKLLHVSKPLCHYCLTLRSLLSKEKEYLAGSYSTTIT